MRQSVFYLRRFERVSQMVTSKEIFWFGPKCARGAGSPLRYEKKEKEVHYKVKFRHHSHVSISHSLSLFHSYTFSFRHSLSVPSTLPLPLSLSRLRPFSYFSLSFSSLLSLFLPVFSSSFFGSK